MRKIILILLIISFKAHSQKQNVPLVDSNFPRCLYQSETNQFLNIKNIDNVFSLKPSALYVTDFDLKKNKAIKNMSIDFNSDDNQEYYYEFDEEGKTTFIHDFVRLLTHTYNYSKNLIAITEFDDHFKRNVEIDSIYFDDKKNIIKQSYYIFSQNGMAEGDFGHNVVEYKYSEANKLTERYDYNHNKSNILKSASHHTYEHEADSIVEKIFYLSAYDLNKNELFKNPAVFGTDYKRYIYYLNKNIYKINIGNNRDASKRQYTLTYNNLGKIIKVINNQDDNVSDFKFNADNNISEIKIDHEVSIYKYDAHNNYISQQIKGSPDILKKYSFVYDQNGNWIERIEKISNTQSEIISRKINYY